MAAKKPAKSAKSKANSTPSKRGGARPGAGRPTNDVRKAKQELNARIVDQVADWSPELLRSMKRLAIGGYKRVKVRYELAALVMAEEQLTDERGELRYGPSGAPLMRKFRAFPDAGPEDMVCLSRDEETADGDRAAGAYLLDRGAGKPTQAIELSGDNGGAIPLAIDVRIDQLWGEKAEGEEDGES